MIDRIIINYYKCIGQSDIKFNRFKDIIVSNNGVGTSPTSPICPTSLKKAAATQCFEFAWLLLL